MRTKWGAIKLGLEKWVPNPEMMLSRKPPENDVKVQVRPSFIVWEKINISIFFIIGVYMLGEKKRKKEKRREERRKEMGVCVCLFVCFRSLKFCNRTNVNDLVHL